MVIDDRQILLRGPEVAAMLGISRPTVYRWIATGFLPVIRINGFVRVPKGALLQWIEAKTEQAIEAAI